MNIPLHELKRMMEAGTPGPWFTYVPEITGGSSDDWIIARHQPEYRDRDMMAIVGSMLSDGSNPELICAMRNALPSLLAVVEKADKILNHTSICAMVEDRNAKCDCGVPELWEALAPFQGKEK